MKHKILYDVIVIGSGHAGVEAAYAASRLHCRVLILTVNWNTTARMSCNPSIGGLGKGHIVKEIDILGGLMPKAADASCIQFKRLNITKGPAVRGSRAQCDKELYSEFIRNFIAKKQDPACQNISFLSREVHSLIFKNNKCIGVVTNQKERFFCHAVVLTAGTFMQGVLHVGSTKQTGGRVGEKATSHLSHQLKNLAFPLHRLKTGTPPRLKKRSIDFSILEEQKGDKVFRPFSFFSPLKNHLPQRSCYVTYTNRKTHTVIRDNLHKSPLFTGAIQAKGPRYCPSVEDKVTCFPHKQKHLSFLEPETLNGESIYLQGLSTSLPADVQCAFLKTIKGLKNVEILQPGYAVEYDFFNPQILKATLECKNFKNLFFAGQINGSSGYEEAAGQGLVAGINAGALVKNLEPFILKRHTAYIGVLIDDLVTKGTKEPYRMLTSRAEHRLALREDNVIERLFDLSKKYKLLDDQKLKLLEIELTKRNKLLKYLASTTLVPNKTNQNQLKSLNTAPLLKPQSLKNILCRPEISMPQIKNLVLKLNNNKLTSSNPFLDCSYQTLEAVEIRAKYEGYIQRSNSLIAQNKLMENTLIENINFAKVSGLSKEALEKLQTIRPKTLAQAGRISGIPPAALQAILIYLKINEHHKKSPTKIIPKT